MTDNRFAARDNSVFEVAGRMAFQTVPQFLAHTDELLQSDAKPVTIDMRGVTLADSAGLALMIEWVQLARAAKREVVFSHIPEQMRDLIRVSGLERVFFVSRET